MREPEKTETRILNCIPSKDTQNDWSVAVAADAGFLDTSASLPAEVDLRDDTWWDVADQGTTGSCVGWATADSVLRWHLVKAGRIGPAEPMSPRFVWMASKETDIYVSHPTTFIDSSGTSLKAALDILRKYGAVQESVLPFEGGLFEGSPQAFYAMASRYKIGSYFSLGRDAGKWREWLAFNGPILTRLDIDETWDRATENNGRLERYKKETARGGHAIALVGYDRNSFVVRNSWGSDWGHQGFAYASDTYAEEAFTEAYGIIP